MPLARLSIKSAIHLAQSSVSLHHHRGDLWVVRTKYSDGTETSVSQSPALPRVGAKAARRERRIFVALLALGIDPMVAAGLSVKSKEDQRDWRALVAFFLEQFDLGGAS